jgi:thiamine-monophosphate kinase
MHPFTDIFEESVANLGETALIKSIRTWLGDAAPAFPEGMGDDTAVISGKRNLLTNDSLIYGRHFDDSATPEAAGAKLLKRNLSDIASMGGTPGCAVIAFFMPPETSVKWLECFTRSMAKCALEYGVKVVGGDTAGTDEFLAGTLTLEGHSERPLLRKQAQKGEYLFVTGSLGGSILKKHLEFIPRLQEGLWLGKQPEVTGCMDITDGLAKDLPTFLEHKSALLDLESIPISDDAKTLAGKDGLTLLQHTFCDGEDYELLISVKTDSPDAFKKRWEEQFTTALTGIGLVAENKDGIVLKNAQGNPLPQWSGYEHLKTT